MRRISLLLTVATSVFLALASPALGAQARGDFNSDGFEDLAMGVPGEEITSQQNAGAVSVIYGSSSGLDPSGSPAPQTFSQDSSGVPGVAEPGDRFGQALAIGDFNSDNADDLAIGAPEEAVGAASKAGAIAVIYGVPASGLDPAGTATIPAAQGFDQNHPSIPGGAEPNDRFGSALASGNFDRVNADDLAIGVPGENGAQGAINTIYGSNGLDPTGVDDGHPSQYFDQNSAGVPGVAEPGDELGRSLAAGDFDESQSLGGRPDDLAIGVPLEDAGALQDSGTVNVIYGQGFGPLDPTGTPAAQGFDQNDPNIPGGAEPGDQFGAALESADPNSDDSNATDLVIGVPLEDLGATADAGVVDTIEGETTTGLNPSAGSAQLSQADAAIPGAAEPDDRFGFALAAGDFDDTGSDRDDIVIGVPGEDVGALADAGGVNVVNAGIDDQYFDQNDPNIPGFSETGDQFGFSLATSDFDSSDIGGADPDDLAVGVPFEDAGTLSDSGAVNTLYSEEQGAAGLDPAGDPHPASQYFDQGSSNVPGEPEAGDQLGFALGDAAPN